MLHVMFVKFAKTALNELSELFPFFAACFCFSALHFSSLRFRISKCVQSRNFDGLDFFSLLIPLVLRVEQYQALRFCDVPRSMLSTACFFASIAWVAANPSAFELVSMLGFNLRLLVLCRWGNTKRFVYTTPNHNTVRVLVCPNHNNIRFLVRCNDESILAQTIIPFVF